MNANNFVKDKKNILVLYKERKFNKVIKFGKKLLKKNSQDYELLYILGLSSLNLQDYVEAEKFFKKILLFREDAEIFYIYGNINSKLKNYENAEIFFNKAVILNPKFSEAYNNLGNIKKLKNKIDQAIHYYNKAISVKKENLTAYFNLAVLLKEERKYVESKMVYEKILNLDKKNLTAKHDLGAINSILGNFELARQYYKEVLQQDKKNYKSYKNYIEITKINENDEIFKKLENLSTVNTSDQNKVDMFYCLSKGYFDQNKNRLGFEYLEKGKSIKKINSHFSIKRENKIFKNLKNNFDNEFSKEINHKSKISKIPIFILGMPRSGTTLIERILSVHSKIYGAGELMFLPKIIEEFYIKKNKSFDETIVKIRTEYSKQLLKLSSKEYIIDKLPLNFKWIGFIIKAFPEAKIIHLNRNPMAVCWSNYKINFRDFGMEFALSQTDIAQYYVMYNELMKFWFRKFNDKIININYEKFVLNHEKETKIVIKELGLDWEESLKKYNENNIQPVETASLYQVRGKIIKNTSHHWKNYKDYLKVMQKILVNNNIEF